MVPVAVLGALAVALAVALVISHRAQQKLTRRLLDVGRRLDPDVQPSGPSLDDAAAVVERAVERTLVRGSDVSVSEGRLVRALGALPLGVVVFDESGDVVARNDEAARFVAARHSEALVEEAIGELGARALGGTAASRTVDLFGPPRRILVLESVPLDLEGRRVGALVVVDDVSERRRLEAVRRDFVANISHELKTPVGALALLAETLLAEDDPVVSRRLSERMLSEAFRVGRTIDDLLELSRIEAEEHAVRQPTPVDLILAEAVDRVAPAAERSAITIEVSEPPGRPTVVGDRRQLVSATYNLLENAVKYSDKGSSVEIEAAAVDGWIEITVTDSGIGIPRRDLERIFERFYRVDRARSRETGGTGLGLAIVRHVANNHQGEVRVESQEGEGSVFTLRLPAGPGTSAGGEGR